MLNWKLPRYDALDALPAVTIGKGMSQEERFQLFSDVSRDFLELDVADTERPPNLDMQGWFDSDFTLAVSRYDGCSFTKLRNTALAQECLELYAFSSGTTQESTAASEPDSVGLYAFGASDDDMDYSEHFGTEGVSLHIPYETVGFDPSKSDAYYDLGGDSSIGKIIKAALQDVARRMPYVPSQDASALIGEIADLVHDLVLGNRKEINRPNFIRARRLAIDAHIEDNIFEATLGVAGLAQEFAVSRASLYRMFEPDSGVEAYITKRRLHRTLLELKQTSARRGAIRQVSERFGFYDAGNFNRAFKSQFGYKPSDVLGAGHLQAAE